MRWVRRVFIVWLLWPAASWGAEPHIDLTAQPWFIKEGFTPPDAAGFPEVAGRPAGPFPISPNRIFGVPTGGAYRHFTLETTFRFAEAPKPGVILGLFLASIGESWEIFVNGERIADALALTADGSPLYRRSLRDAVFAIPSDLLHGGENRLVFHLAGSEPATRFAWNTSLGFYQRNGYFVAPFFAEAHYAHELGALAMLSLFFFFAAFALTMFLYRRKESALLYFGLLSAALSAYFLTRTNVLYSLFVDTSPLFRIEYASLTLAGPCMLLFLHRFFERPANRFVPMYAAISAVLFVGALTVPFGYLDPILLAWQALTILGAAYVAVFIGAAIATQRPWALHLVPGLLLIVAAVGWDIADTVWLFRSRETSQYAFAGLVLNVAAVITVRALQMRKATQQAVVRLGENEQRLRALFESGFEGIVISADGRIVDANPAFERLFGFATADAVGRRTSELFARPNAPPGAPGSEVAMLRADGTMFFAEVWQQVTRDGATTLVIRDIDEKRRAADELKERNHELEVLVRSMAEREKRMRELENQLASRHPENK